MTVPEITTAAAILRAGGLVAMPTETVYGLGADACNEAALRKVFSAKERPFDHPLIVHIAELSQMNDWAREVPPTALRLAEAFWPGPLTLILKKQPHVLDIVTGGQDTIGLRMPRHPVALALLKAFGGGVAAPSANKFTHISPTTAAAVREELADKVDLILDGGDCEVGLESTIVDLTGDVPVILRPGMISAEALTNVIGIKTLVSRQENPIIRVPGMHHLHYAPVTKTLLMEMKDIPVFLQSLQINDLPAAVVTYHQLEGQQIKHIHHVQLSNEAASYAHDLYRTLRELDNQKFKCIIVEAVPASSEWDAIRDRLSKASAG